MTVYRDRFLVNKTNRCIEFQFLLVIITVHVSGSLSAHHQEHLSRTMALVQFMQLGDRVLPGSGWNGGWDAPDDGQKDCPRHVELLLPIKIGTQCICWFYLQGNWIGVLTSRNADEYSVGFGVIIWGHFLTHINNEMPSIFIVMYRKLSFKEGTGQLEEDFVTQRSSSIISHVLIWGNLSILSSKTVIS
jgi:hypothetical protein